MYADARSRMRPPRLRYRPLLFTAVYVFLADALTKVLAAALLRRSPARLPDGWALQVAHNPGGFLGLGAGTIAPDVFAVLGAVEIALLLFVGRRDPRPLRAVALGLILGGATGNVGESRIFGYVVDWIKPPQPNIVFDLADVAIACGQVSLLVLYLLSLCTSKVRVRAAVTR